MRMRILLVTMFVLTAGMTTAGSAAASTGVGTSTATAAGTVTPNAATWCGARCHFADPYTALPRQGDAWDGVKCGDTQEAVSSGVHPTLSNGHADTTLTIWLYYSTRCQTTWVRATTSQAIGRTVCIIADDDPRAVESPGRDCPPAGTTSWTGMSDDHDANNGAVNHGFAFESTVQGGCTVQQRSSTCYWADTGWF